MEPNAADTRTESRQVRLRITWRYLVAFAALTILCGTSHEFVHHFSAAAICGGFGVKTFNSFDIAPGCEANPWHWAATLAGPAFTFGLMWWGALLLRRQSTSDRQIGFALIFANFPINRLFFVLIYANDEYDAAFHLFGRSELVHLLTIAATWLIALPPVVIGYRAIANPKRPLWFAAFFILPFVFVLTFAAVFLENYLLLEKHFLASRVLGVPWLILVVEGLSLAIYYAFRRDLTGRRRLSD
ncbi:hypothetical protein G7078_08325 [Sphingomonas sinipercae]|uniref:Uncharacterized protein n=1 Tax=Sphingomonas sinipercae TaxID=2714944 RepID=A0A6G7ZPC8_9SPHN|nr:hypothetical protein [Sphingomonas sinipercae]QIL02785.1 hypothetical protein G7078_08325 [Sphingomonas sinipercae]